MKKGLFWCVDYKSDKPILVIKAVDCDNYGNALTDDVEYTSKSKENFNHKIEWDKFDSRITKGNKYNFYPRGRVEIKNCRVIIYLNPDINSKKVIQRVVEVFELEDITDIKIHSDGSSHYEYTAGKSFDNNFKYKKLL